MILFIPVNLEKKNNILYEEEDEFSINKEDECNLNKEKYDIKLDDKNV